ncbi:MAG TPA: hypothetical protein VHA33_15345 [Candidatus Angelobacter sp.]|jgi:hypothetical protein|nr:hypothetical protein [Candidatus Angelobacter sp.]
MFNSIVLIIAMLAPLAACQTQCRDENLSANPIQRLCLDGSNLPEWQWHKTATQTWLLDAPSRRPPTQGEKFRVFVEDAASPLTVGAVSINATVMHSAEEERLAARQTGLAALYGTAALQKESGVFFGKYLYASLLKQDPRYYPSTSNNLLERALYAASRVLITHKDSGGRTLNTSYFLGLLTAKVLATAYRPYWARSNSITFKTFGSSIGSDIGIDLLHEFGPGIRQLLKRHSPKFLRGQ